MASGGYTLPPPQPLDINSPKAADCWRKFSDAWENYALATGLTDKPEPVQVATLLTVIGEDAREVFSTFTDWGEADANKKKIKPVIAKFKSYCQPRKNVPFERYKFNIRMQEAGEPYEQYRTSLRKLAEGCKFDTISPEEILRDRLVFGIRDTKVRERLLRETELTLQKTDDICRAAESTTGQMKLLGDTNSLTSDVNKVMRSNERRPPQRQQGERHCRYCRGQHVFKKSLCPAYGKTCNSCQGKNHFGGSEVCKNAHEQPNTSQKKGRIHTIHNNGDSSEGELINAVETPDPTDKPLYCEMLVEGQAVKFQVGDGATVCTLPLGLVPKAKHTELKPSPTPLLMWDKSKFHPTGEITLKVRNPKNNSKYRVKFVTFDNNLTPLLGRPVVEKMGLVTINYDNFKQVNTVLDESKLFQHEAFSDGIGKLPGRVHFETRPDVKPVICPPRKLPVSLKDKVRAELNRLMQLEVITEMDEPSDWVSQIAISTKRSGELRICIDPRPLNAALKREHFQLPVMDDLLPSLVKAKVFSKLDLTNGYWHCTLDEDSSKLTTFVTPFGRYRWLRLPFGTSVSSEIFQKRLLLAVNGLDGVFCVADDIVVYGIGDTLQQANIDHDSKLESFLRRCSEQGIRLNKKKCEIRKTEIPFLGHLLTSEGLKIDPNKCTAILDLQPPTGVEEVQRLNGMVNYLAKFLPRLSDVMEPIRQLTRSDVVWHWTHVQDAALEEVKRLITSAPVLRYYNPKEQLVIQCDASDKGLGATLLQSGKPISFASRALTDTETRYAQIEKETLSVVFALNKFREYTFGRHTVVHSDHKPLEAIVRKPLHRAPRRLQGMLLSILEYDIDIVWKPGKEMLIADMLSRAYLPYHCSDGVQFTHINMVGCLSITTKRLETIKTETDHDETLQKLKTVILQGWPDDKTILPIQLHPYYHFRDELSVQNGMMFKGERVIIPATLRSELKKSIHSSHLGIESCLRRARECLYWPGMSAEIKSYISTCEACRTFETKQQKETLMSHGIPDRPWSKVGCDLFTFRDNEYVIVVDYFSNYWEVDKLGRQATSRHVINKLKAQFARHGIPETVVTDGGPQFSSGDFHNFSAGWDFKHIVTSPHHSQSNGKAESAVKSAKSLFKKCSSDGSDPLLAILELRNTPNQGMDSSPVQRMFNRRTRSTMPMHSSLLQPRTIMPNQDKRNLEAAQQRQAKYYNRQAKDLPTLVEGDTVRLQPFKLGDKQWKEATVEKRIDERSYRVSTPDGQVYRRNRVYLRRTPGTIETADQNDTENITPKPMVAEDEGTSHIDTSQDTQSAPESAISPKTYITRSGRSVKPPKRFDC